MCIFIFALYICIYIQPAHLLNETNKVGPFLTLSPTARYIQYSSIMVDNKPFTQHAWKHIFVIYTYVYVRSTSYFHSGISISMWLLLLCTLIVLFSSLGWMFSSQIINNTQYSIYVRVLKSNYGFVLHTANVFSFPNYVNHAVLTWRRY